MALEHPQTMTVEEYFQLEENDTEHRYEYIDGHVYMLAGGTFDHSTISGNIHSTLRGLLRGKACLVYDSDIKVCISQKRYVHPDVTVTCDPADRGTGDLLHSPKVIFEVLSPSTEIADRTWKLQNCLALPTLEAFILVNTKSHKLEMYHKEQGKWIYAIYHAHDALPLPGLDIQFPLQETYVDIELAATPLGEENDNE